MRRREFIALMGGAAMASARVARAQESGAPVHHPARGIIETIFPSSKKLSFSQNWLVVLTIAGPVSGLKGLICAKPLFPTSQGGRCKYGPA